MAQIAEYAMLVPTCNSLLLLFNDSCEKKTKRYMLPHAHRDGFNMEPCTACGEKRISHNPTGAGKRCNQKKQPSPIAVLWQI